jgi:hypothetical protein
VLGFELMKRIIKQSLFTRLINKGVGK